MGQQQLLNALIHTLSYTVKTKTAKEYGALLDELEMTGSISCTKAWIKWARRQLDPRCMISNKKRYEIIQKALAASSWSEEEKEKQWRIHMDKVPELSLSTIYHMLATHTPETIGSLVNGSAAEGFERLPEGHPGRIAFHFFDNQNEKLKYGMLGNLGTRLQLLQSRNIRRILRNKDIRLADAGDHQVVWFVIIPDQSTTTRAISSLFFNFLFKDNADMSDALGGRNRVRVNFIMDEFANIGLIPNIDKKINIARGRNLSLCMILQDIKQLDNVYGMEAAPVIISGCNTIVFLGSDNPETCEFFSRLSGEATIVVNTVRNSRGVGRVDPLAKEYQQSTGEGKRYVYTEHEVRTLPKEECLIWVSGYNVLKARKFWWFTHPGSRTADGKDLPEMKPSTHTPAAVKYQDTEYRDAFLDSDDLIFIEAEEEPDTKALEPEEPSAEPPDEPSEKEEPPQTVSEAPQRAPEAEPACPAQTNCAPPDPKPLNLESFRKDPSISFDYSADDLRRERGGEDEPTQYLPNMGVTRTKQQHYTPAPADDEDEDDRPRGGWWKTLLLILVVAAVGYFGVTRLYQGIMDSFAAPVIPEYTVPDLTGLTADEARALPEVEGVFEIVEGSKHEYSTEYAEGQIIRQDPEADRKKKSSNNALIPITVTLSLGTRSGEMLNLVDQEARSAKLLLEQTKGLSELRLNVVEAPEQEYHDEIDAGYVIRTEPAAGTILKEGDTVTLYVSKGPEIKYSTMVACVGQSMEWVQNQMTQLNLTAEFQEVEGSAPAGQVLTQSVEVGESVEEGSTIVFTYSDGQALVIKTISFNVPYSPEEVHVEIYLDDTAIFDDLVPGDYGLLERAAERPAGDYQLRVYADGQLWRDEVFTFSE